MKKNIFAKIIRSLIFVFVVVYGLSKFIIPVYATEGDNIPIVDAVSNNSEQQNINEEVEQKEGIVLTNNDEQQSVDEKTENKEEITINDSSSNEKKEDQDIIKEGNSGNLEKQEEEKKEVENEEKIDENSSQDDKKEESFSNDLKSEAPKEEKKESVIKKKSLSKSVTEHDVASFITSATISTTQSSQSEYEVSVGTRYDIVLEFAETPTHQFPNDGTLVYNLPPGFDTSLIHDSGTFSINVHTPDGTVTVRNNHYVVNGGKITINWSEDENVHTLFAANNAKFYVRFRAYFDGTEDEIPWNDVVVTPLHFDDKESNLEMVKVSSPSLATYQKKIDYTISLTSTGINNDINISDSITGNGVTLIPSSFVVTSSTDNFNYTITPNGNSFTFTAPKMTDGQIVTITYAASLNETLAARDNDDVFYLSANNKATLKSEGHTDIIRETNDRIEIKPEIEKVGTIIDENHILWHVSINVNNKLLINNMPVIDTIDPNSTSHMQYDTTQQFTIKVYNSDGNLVRTIPVSWSDILNNTETGWTYLIPYEDNDDRYRYEFEYTTTYDNSGNDKVVENDVHFGDNDYSSGVYVHGEADINLEKEAKNVNLTEKTVTWEIVIHVPKVGLDSSNNVLTETYPKSPYIEDVGFVYEPVVNGSVNVTGLLPNETYEIQYYDTYAEIKFKKGGVDGLYSTELPRDINITLKTTINEKWLEQASSATYFINHINTITMGKTVTAIARIAPPMIVKSVSDAPTVTIDNNNYPVYKYTVKTGMLNDDNFELTDTFDTSIFKIYIPTEDALRDYLIMFGGNTYDNQNDLVGGNPAGWNNPQRINYVETATGLKFIITPDKLPKNGDDLYPYYSFSYYLIPKNLSSLRELMQRAATSNNATYEFENKIKYNDELEASVKGKYTHSALKKREVGFDEETGIIDFEIEINPDALVLNEMGSITLVDTYNNMSVIYDTIEVTPPNGVFFDSSGNSITFTLPDAKSIIVTYSARLIYEQPEPNGSVRVDYSNTATLLTGTFEYSSGIEDYKYVVSVADGNADVYAINLLKYEAGNMTVRLAGAVFELLDENEKNIVDKNDNKVVFISDNDGKILIEGDQDLYGWSIIANKKYYLRETKAPEGYKIANFLYQFTIASNGKADYDHYIYYSGDTLTVKNYPGTDIFVEKEWENGADKHQSDVVTVKLQEKIGNGEWQDSLVAPITLSATNNWRGSFAGLPLITTINYAEVQIAYRIVEFLVNGQPVEDGTYEITLLQSNPTTYKILNKYETVGEAEISVLKVLNGRNWTTNDEFEFTISAEAGTPLPSTTTITITNTTNEYKASFGKINYTEEGTYTYTITETHKGETINGVVYDSTDKTVTFKLVDDGNGHLILDPTGPQTLEATFTNDYNSKGEIIFSGLKELKGKTLEKDAFEFELLDSNSTVIDTAKNASDGTFTFSKIEYTLSDLDKDTNGNYIETLKTYKIREVKGNDPSITYDETVYDITIKLNDNGKGKITAISNPNETSFKFVNTYHTNVLVSKVDLLSGEELAGATIKVLDKEQNIIDEWISSKELHKVNNLNVNKEYTLIETIAPEGYTISKKITFTIDENGKVTTTGHTTTDENGNIIILVEDEKTIIRITKVDIVTKKEVAGAKLQVVDNKGNIVEEWISTNETHIIEGLKTGETYTLKEIVAPDGYKVTTDSTFTIDENGKVTTTGHTTTDENGNIIILVEDDKTKVYISKVDIETGEDLEGATIQILDSKGNIVETWTTTKEVHLVEGLKVDEEYTIRETSAPDGYKVAEDITFTIDENGKVITAGKIGNDNDGNTVLLVQDYKIPTTPPSENPKTADYFEIYYMLFELFVFGFISSIIYLRKLDNAQ